jgi:hypothetical protein
MEENVSKILYEAKLNACHEGGSTDFHGTIGVIADSFEDARQKVNQYLQEELVFYKNENTDIIEFVITDLYAVYTNKII